MTKSFLKLIRKKMKILSLFLQLIVVESKSTKKIRRKTVRAGSGKYLLYRSGGFKILQKVRDPGFRYFLKRSRPQESQISPEKDMFKYIRDAILSQSRLVLTGQFPTVSYVFVPACVKLAHFSLWEEIAQD